ncbi:E3 ubiquitin-protein ligase ZNF598 isoform X2 [Rhynchophorus ferrugineus]|uniref:E3 ubiquitin-protein ligase ZNF598 isoform X2 n=1 Tax=Rhynchophorus ferrugineus TaxID=354439 RepID=UPI003FCCDE4C
MSSKNTQNSTDNDNICVVCFKDVDIYSIGSCDHAVCFECSTRMRVLCKQNECPICRRDLPKVLFSKKIEPYSIIYPRFERSNLQHKRFGIVFSTLDVQKAYQKLLEHRCQICEENEHKWPFKNFIMLKDHMRRDHELFYCDICSESLKIFSFERKCYTRQDLAHHRRKGDRDNTSHRGHPLCEFCDTRFMDNDDLFRHLRRNHLFCHLCDADGKYQYYATLSDLKIHFHEEHFLCEEGECKNMPLTAVFRSNIDFKAHITQEHSKSMSKSATKQARTLEFEFTLAPRPRSDNMRNKRSDRRDRCDAESTSLYNVEPGGPGGGIDSQPNVFINPLSADQFPALAGASTAGPSSLPSKNYTKFSSAAFSSNDFPSLGEPSNRASMPAVTITATPAGNSTQEVTITRTVRNQKHKENFPALAGPSKGSSSTVRLSVNNNQQQAPKVSIQFNQKSNGVITTQITTSSPSTTQRADGFPALGRPVPVAQPQWVPSKPKKTEEPKSARVAPCPVLEPSDLNSFPSLSKGKSEKPKKTSSVTMPVSSWVNLNSMKNVSKNKRSESNGNAALAKQSNSTDLREVNYVEEKQKPEENKKQKKKKGKTNIETDHKEQVVTQNDINENEDIKSKNGLTKKRSELRVERLTNFEESSATYPPPGFANKPHSVVKPPPGFDSSNFPSLGMTFTNSSGQSYSISPTTSENYRQPRNFQSRNQQLIKKFMEVVNDNEAIKEFKTLSDNFRKGDVSAKVYHKHCQKILGHKFDDVFPELLVLLPDIRKQQELHEVISKSSKAHLVACENCKQVIFKNELSDHYNYHRLDNHFPSLGTAQQINNNAWGK